MHFLCLLSIGIIHTKILKLEGKMIIDDTQNTKSKCFGEQVYAVKNSRISILVAKIKTAIRLLCNGEFPRLARKLVKDMNIFFSILELPNL